MQVTLLTIYCVLLIASSLFGGVLPSLLNLTHRRMQFLVSFVGGLMLGVAILHQFPHAIAVMSNHGQSAVFALNWCTGWFLAGLLTTFFMLRVFHFHHHEAVVTSEDHDHLCSHDHDHDHDQECLATHDHDSGMPEHRHSHYPAQGASWVGILLGMTIHSLMDGAALTANVQADAMHSSDIRLGTPWLLGFSTFLGIVLHKPLDSLTISAVMTARGWPRSSMQIVNVAYALVCPIGAVIFFLGMQQFGGDSVLAAALAFSAGVFVCISLSDLLPEVQFHSHDGWLLSLALLTGVLLAWAIGLIEPGDIHGHGHVH